MIGFSANAQIVTSPEELFGFRMCEDHIADMAVGVSVTHSEGDVVLTSIRPQFRAQSHGTFKILFNALISRE